MWITLFGDLYSGDCASGDRAATAQEIAAYDIARAKADRLGEIEAAYQAQLDAGVVYGGHAYQIDDASQQKINAVATRAGFVVSGMAGATWPDGFIFIAADNTLVPFTAAQFIPMALAAADRVTSLIMTRLALKGAVAAAVTMDDLAAVVPLFAA